MEKSLQKKLRSETRELFFKIAYQQLVQASFSAKQFDGMAAQVKKNTATIEANESEIRLIKARLDHHSVENRTRMKELEEAKNALFDASRQLQPIMNQLNEEIKVFSQKGERHLKLAEYCQSFEMSEATKEVPADLF